MVCFINVVHVKGSDTSYSNQEVSFVSIDALSSFGNHCIPEGQFRYS